MAISGGHTAGQAGHVDDHNLLDAAVAAKLDTATAASTYATTGALAGHEADTTNIHGIADTAALATTASVTAAVAPKLNTADLGTSVAALGDASFPALLARDTETTAAVLTETNRATAAEALLLSTAAAPELIRDTIGTALVAGTNVTITPNDGADTITIAATGGGSSDAYIGRYRPGGFYSAPPTVANSSVTLTASVEFAVPFVVTTSVTLDRLMIEVVTAGGGSTIRLGIRSDTGTGLPGTLVLDAGTVDGTATGQKALTISQALTPGVYWLTQTAQGGTPAVRSSGTGTAPNGPFALGWTTSVTVTNQSIVAYTQPSVTGALPGTFATPVGLQSSNNQAPVIYFRAV